LFLRDLLNYLETCKNSGSSFDELKREFGDDNKEEIKRLLDSASDMGEIKSDGKGRGLRYYLPQYEIIKIMPDIPKENANKKMIQGIDLNDCITSQDKAKKIIASDIPLTDIVSFQYKQKLFNQTTGKELYDFIHDGAKYVDIKLHHNPKSNKNEIFYKKIREIGNAITIKYKEGEWLIIKTDHACPERPETKSYTNYSEFEKCLKTLFLK
jgi:hypothetical protein